MCFVLSRLKICIWNILMFASFINVISTATAKLSISHSKITISYFSNTLMFQIRGTGKVKSFSTKVIKILIYYSTPNCSSLLILEHLLTRIYVLIFVERKNHAEILLLEFSNMDPTRFKVTFVLKQKAL